MRKRLAILAGIGVLLLAAGCSAMRPQTGAAAGAGVKTVQKSSVQTTYTPPDREQVRNAYDRAVDAVGWFQSGTMPCTGSTVSLESGVYRKVSYAGVESLNDLKNYLRGLFSEELVDSLLTKKIDGEACRFLEKSGVLYELQRELPVRERTGRVKVSVRRRSARRYEVDVQTQLLAADGKTVTGVKYNACFFEKQEEKWIFTNFDLPGLRGGK